MPANIFMNRLHSNVLLPSAPLPANHEFKAKLFYYCGFKHLIFFKYIATFSAT